MGGPIRSRYMAIVERRDLGGNLCRVTIAANEKVRQPPELDIAGLSTENYTRNPVVMWAHDAVGRSPSGGLPIGRTLSLDKTSDGRLVADFEFLGDDPFAQRVNNAWDKGFLQAASISWIPLESVPAEGGRWRDIRSDLLEWSIVSVPADPEALRDSQRRMIDAFLGESAPGLEARGEDALEYQGPGSHPQSDNEPALSPGDWADLTVALTLLNGVVEEGSPSGRAGGSTNSDNQDEKQDSEGEMMEIRVMVEAIRSAVLSS